MSAPQPPQWGHHQPVQDRTQILDGSPQPPDADATQHVHAGLGGAPAMPVFGAAPGSLPEPTQAIRPGGMPGPPDATQVVGPAGVPEATQAVVPVGLPGAGAPEATQALR